MAVAERFVDAKIDQRKVLLFCKSYIPACNRIIELLEPLNLDSDMYEIVFIDKRQDVVQIENYFQVLCLSDSREVPQLFICGKYFGGPEKIFYWNKLGKLAEKVHEAIRASVQHIETVEEPTPTPAQKLSTSESVPEPTPAQELSTLESVPEPTPAQELSTSESVPEPTPAQELSTSESVPEPT
ncbi:uncharacterized protein LOC106867645, partial [Octopus bimaculoides]